MRKWSLGKWLILFAVFFGGGMIYIWCTLESLNVGYQVSRELQSQKKLKENHLRLKVQWANLMRHETLEHLAKVRFDLAPPKKEQMVALP
jgi:cell division protein FtsL